MLLRRSRQLLGARLYSFAVVSVQTRAASTLSHADKTTGFERIRFRPQPPEHSIYDSKCGTIEVPLESRKVIKVEGPDALQFLQGLVTADVSKHVVPQTANGQRPSFYAAFLNAQGRVLHDVYLFPPMKGPVQAEGLLHPPNCWFIDVDAGSHDALLGHLKKHKLRSKVRIESMPNIRPHDHWPSSNWSRRPDGRFIADEDGENATTFLQGDRVIFDENDADNREVFDYYNNNPGIVRAWQEALRSRRVSLGIAEGQAEIVSGSALPQESNIDLLGGIDFRKGCYLGQELTIRTHHTGVVRKRILPMQIYDDHSPVPTIQKVELSSKLLTPPPGANISKVSSRKGRSAGKWLGGIGNIGLGLCRLEMMTDIKLTDEGTQYDRHQEFLVSWEDPDDPTATKVIRVKAFVPLWIRRGIQARMAELSTRNSQKQEKQEEDVGYEYLPA